MTNCTCEKCQTLRATITATPGEAINPAEIEQWLQLPNEKRPPLWGRQAERRKAQRQPAEG
jgi:hypothetical protein